NFSPFLAYLSNKATLFEPAQYPLTVSPVGKPQSELLSAPGFITKRGGRHTYRLPPGWYRRLLGMRVDAKVLDVPNRDGTSTKRPLQLSDQEIVHIKRLGPRRDGVAPDALVDETQKQVLELQLLRRLG